MTTPATQTAAPAAPPQAPAAAEQTKAPAEQPKPESTEPKVDDEKAQFVRRETELQRATAAHKAQMEKDRAELEKQKGELEKQRGEVKSILEARELFQKGDVKKALDLLGTTYDDLTLAQLKNLEGDKTLTKKDLEKFKQDLEAENAQKIQAAQARADEEAIELHRKGAHDFVEKNPAAYRFLRKFGSEDAVHNFIVKDLQDRAKKDDQGNVLEWPAPMSFKDAADKLEKQYRDNAEAARKEEEEELKKGDAKGDTKKPIPSLSSDLNAGGAAKTSREFKDDDERMNAAQEAIRAAREAKQKG